MFEIENGIPIPKKGKTGGGKYPWKAMQAGDSFLVPITTSANSSRTAVKSSARHAGVKIITRKVDGGLRVWRAA